MPDHNINIYNKTGSRKGSSSKISAKSTNQNQNSTLTTRSNTNKIQATQISRVVNAMVSIGTGQSFQAVTKTVSKMGLVGLIVGKAMEVGDKVFSFGVNVWEAETGESMIAHNLRVGAQTTLSGGMNILAGSFRNAFITQKNIARQNMSLEYNRTLYNLNIEGTKNKIR